MPAGRNSRNEPGSGIVPSISCTGSVPLISLNLWKDPGPVAQPRESGTPAPKSLVPARHSAPKEEDSKSTGSRRV